MFSHWIATFRNGIHITRNLRLDPNVIVNCFDHKAHLSNDSFVGYAVVELFFEINVVVDI